MHELEYAILTAEATPDPRKRAALLCNAVLKQGNMLELIAKALDDAEQSAKAIIDPTAREEYLSLVNRAMEKVGYNARQKAFRIINEDVRRSY